MATQTNGSKTATPKASSTKRSGSEKSQPRSTAERAVDIPVGAVLTVTDRVTELVEPFSGRKSTEKQLKSYRTRLGRQVKRTERRGATARRRATSEARRATKEARKTIEEQTSRAQDLVDRQTSRAQGLVDRVGEQISSLPSLR